jgi:hypothetical protein
VFHLFGKFWRRAVGWNGRRKSWRQ